MDARERIERLLNHLEMSAPAFAVAIGKDRPQFIYDIQKGKTKNISQELAKQILSAFPQINDVWLLTGQGQMLAEKEKQYRDAKGMVIPLLNIPAMAGYNEDNWSVMIADCPLYCLPDVQVNADFLIKVAGDSMQPKFNEGDLIACKMIKDILFFQWGKTYVLDTSQGVMVKNVYEDTNNAENVLLVSENAEKYPAFSVPRSDIRKLALVTGMIRIRLE